MSDSKPLSEKITEFMNFFSTITKEEIDYIEEILKWDDERKMAFMIAKRLFEEKN